MRNVAAHMLDAGLADLALVVGARQFAQGPVDRAVRPGLFPATLSMIEAAYSWVSELHSPCHGPASAARSASETFCAHPPAARDEQPSD